MSRYARGLVESAREKPRFGYRRLHVLLGRSGEHVNEGCDGKVCGLGQSPRKKRLRIAVDDLSDRHLRRAGRNHPHRSGEYASN